VLAEVEGVPGAGHVLRVLDVLRADADGLLRALQVNSRLPAAALRTEIGVRPSAT
jgi:hypothetical protein